MSTYSKLSEVFRMSNEILIDDNSKIILMSDCHRGDGSWADDFLNNENSYTAALSHYYNEGYTYIELGDGDELWKNRKAKDITEYHSHVFWMLSRFYRLNRLYLMFGNHDKCKKNMQFMEKGFGHYYDNITDSRNDLFHEIRVHEGLILCYKSPENKIFLVHGHQGDLLNDTLWQFSRFLVRYIWRPLELLGFKDPTTAAKNYKAREKVERKLTEWVKKENQMLIAGHTHRPVFPVEGAPLYFNDGSCVHPRGVTGIEIAGGNINLVKWYVKTKQDGTLYVGKDIIGGPRPLQALFDAGVSLDIDVNKFVV